MHLLDIGRAGDVAVGIRLSQEHVGIEQPTHQPVASGCAQARLRAAFEAGLIEVGDRHWRLEAGRPL